MCGIAGVFHYSSDKHSFNNSLRRMLSVIKHRGPDETGIYLGKNIGLGSVRLSIIDVAGGQQPLTNESGRYWIVYNGEIFNYPELRKDLEKRGVRFSTNSDTEVVVQMYATYGKQCLEFFNGQFAFCIWDTVKEELFLARDRVGIRPLYYWKHNETFAFCSEIKGLFTLGQIERKLSTTSLTQVFHCWTTLSPETPFENIFELQPGHFMTVTATSFAIERFWMMEFAGNRNDNSRNISDAAEELTELLRDAVKIRLRSDVPVGAYLSGGLDSSVTTALIHEIEPGILNTYSIGFTDSAFDETSFQLEAAKYFNTNHTAIICSPNEIVEYFRETVWHSEYPILRTAPTPMFLLSKKVRESNIKVVITGEGADEFLAGYNIFKEAKIRRFWAKEPESLSRPRLLTKLYPYLPVIKDANHFALKMFFGYNLTATGDPLYSHQLRWHNTSRIMNYLSDDVIHQVNGYDPLAAIYPNLPDQFMEWSELSRSQYLEATIFMSGYLLSSQGDRMAMGNSVEGRYPFLDYRVIQFCNNLPDRFKLNSLNEKFLLKLIGRGMIPESIRMRPKQAYRAPISGSFFASSAPTYVDEMLSDQLICSYGLFNNDKVRSLIMKVKTGNNVSEIDQMAVAGILSTQLLNEMFVINEIIPPEIKGYVKVIDESGT